jgi:flagellar hook-associated protein 1 FlgK
MAINSVFSIAKSSLFAHQQALAITSANLANANNPAYSRQIAVFGTTPPDNRATFTFGSGVAVQDILRIRNNVTDIQIRNNNHSYYDAEKRATMLSQIESLFSEPSEYGLSNLMAQFFNSWDELALDPSSISLRTSVVQAGQMLSEKIESVHDGISNSKLDIRTEAREVTERINSIVKQLNTVNKQIYDASVVNGNANDLIDTRDSLLEELSQYVNINVAIDENQVANVAIGGVFAVDGLHYKQFKINQDSDTLSLYTDGDEAKANLSGGSLNGLLHLFNKELPEQLDTLDNLAITLMENVNAIHSQGYSLTDPSITGIDFFSKYENGNLEINQDLVNDPFYLAISEDGNSGSNSLAIQIAELKDGNLLNGKTLSENYSEFVSNVANEIRLQEQNVESFAIVLNQLQQTKIEHSGVSTDEEMMNVMKYQRSYDAAAKLITVADELMETLLTLV